MRIPKHLAIIMDGNGRWAQARSLPVKFGHRKGSENLYAMTKLAASYGVSHLTVYAFSTENWQRSDSEVEALISLLPRFLDRYESELLASEVRVRLFGDLSRLDHNLQARVNDLVKRSCNFTKLNLNICFSYGGREEIIRAVKDLADRNFDFTLLDQESLSGALDSAGQPDPDLLIRTGGELRLSNFLLWQLSYTELYFTNCLWPDFGEDELREAFKEYGRRQRRFGRRIGE